MSSPVTFEQVEALAGQLSPKEQLKLVARIGERLSAELPASAPEETEEEEERLRVVRELLAECEGVEDDSQGTSDAAALIRRMRDERVAQICPRGA